jgi:hypothetical protein
MYISSLPKQSYLFPSRNRSVGKQSFTIPKGILWTCAEFAIAKLLASHLRAGAFSDFAMMSAIFASSTAFTGTQ